MTKDNEYLEWCERACAMSSFYSPSRTSNSRKSMNGIAYLSSLRRAQLFMEFPVMNPIDSPFFSILEQLYHMYP